MAATAVAGPRIDIVGGGVAGLTALELLRIHGYDVHLHEKRGAVGGLIGSVAHPVTGEVLGESGPELINSQDAYLLRLIHRYHLHLSPVFRLQNRGAVFEFGGQKMTYEDLQERLFKESASALSELEHYQNNRDTLQGLFAHTLLENCHAGSFLISFMKIFIWTELGWTLRALPAHSLFDYIRIDSEHRRLEFFPLADEGFRVAGGLSQLVDRLRSENAERIETDQELIRVDRSDNPDQFRLTFQSDSRGSQTQSSVIETDSVVLALPSHQMSRVQYSLPGLAKRVKAWSETKYAGTSKVLMWFDGSIAETYGFRGMGMTDQGFQFWGTEGTNPKGSLLTVYSGALPQNPRGQEQRVNRIKAHLNQMFPGFMDHVLGVEVFNYPQSYIGPVPIEIDPWRAEEASERGLFFIGAGFSSVHPGYMDGASNTAFKVLEQIKSFWPPSKALEPCDQMLMAD